ncbi:MAG: hypothetical protein IPI90_07685 [Saprospiraceae bacterium]|nr:hypothetical protein [Candidatus Vicinibacter affinis]
MEIFSKYSPDGSKIAYTAQYDGNSEVYVMPGRWRSSTKGHLHRHFEQR